MQKKTIIFFPVEIGLAHIVRSLGIAEELKKRGHRIIFALPKRKWALLEKSTIIPIDITPYHDKESVGVIHIVKNIPHLERLVHDDLRMLETYRPDSTVVDFRPSAIVASLHTRIPTFCVSGSSSLPFDCYLPDFFIRSPFSPLISLITRHIILKAKEKFMIGPILTLLRKLGTNMCLKELVYTIKYIVPEQPSYLSLPDTPKQVHYVGHLTWNGFNHYQKSLKNSFQNSNKTIYITFGGTGFNKTKLISITSAVIKAGYNAIVSTGTIADPLDFPANNNLRVYRYVSTKNILPFVDAVICHGGYGTIIEAALAGKPIIGIPFNPDQWIHSVRFQELGIGACVMNKPLQHFIKAVTLDWEDFQDMTSQISEKQIIIQLEKTFNDYSSYLKNLSIFIKKNLAMNGEKKAADIIESSL